MLFGRSGGLPAIRVLHMAEGEPLILDQHDVKFPEPAYTCSLVRNAQYATSLLYFAYSSPVTPNTVYAYDMQQRTLAVVKREEVNGYDPEPVYGGTSVGDGCGWHPYADIAGLPQGYRARRQQPGVPVRLWGLWRKHRTALSSRSASACSTAVLSLQWPIFAAAAKWGAHWYETGKMLHKRNTFTDFIACAETLIAAGYTNPARLVVCGRSAGGLLMGAVTNLRPDLFAAVLAGVPFMDVINTMLDPSIPLTAMEYEEWGHPDDARAVCLHAQLLAI